MAATTTEQQEVLPQVPIRILMDKEKNRVIFAEAGKDFVDVLLIFLTFPLGTIARLVGKDSNMEPVRVGCLNSLYESVGNLKEEHLRADIFKSVLLQPRNSMESCRRNLKLNIDDTEPTKYFICEALECNRFKSRALWSTFRNLRCQCGKLLNKEMPLRNSMVNDGFVHETASFIIWDDLSVMPNVPHTSLVLLQELGIENMESIEEMTVNVSKKEVLDLLKCALLSKTPLTDLFIKKKQFLENFNPRNQSHFEIGEMPTDKESRKMVVEVLLRKSNGKVLFALGEQDFADFLFSFLTFPLGGVLHMLEGCSSLSCIDKLYRSMTELSADKYLISQELKNNLVNLQCATQFKLNNHILPIGEACFPNYYCATTRIPLPEPLENFLDDIDGEEDIFHEYEILLTNDTTKYASDYKLVPLDFVDPKCFIGETSSAEGFMKGPSTYMVTDDLVVTPVSSISVVSFLNKSEVPFSDVEKNIISIGTKEGLSILKASLISTSALTNGLHQIIRNIKQEN